MRKSRFGRIRRWRMQRAIGVLKPWWGPRIDLARARLNEQPYGHTRNDGYRMGVYSTLRSLAYLEEAHPAYEIDPRYGLIGVPPKWANADDLSASPAEADDTPFGPDSSL